MSFGTSSRPRVLTYVLPGLMALFEWILRVATKQPDTVGFMPISLVVTALGFYIMLTSVPDEPIEPPSPPGQPLDPKSETALRFQAARKRHKREEWVGGAGFWLTLFGGGFWFLLLGASISEELKNSSLYDPVVVVRASVVYYGLAVIMTEWKARR